MKRTLHHALWLLTASLPLAGCAADSTLGEPIGKESATLVGRVGGADSGASGATVKLWRAAPGGQREVVASEDGAVHDDGSFQIGVDPARAGGGSGPLVVELVKDGKTIGAALVAATIEAGKTAYAKPIDVESSAEVDVLVSLTADGATPDAALVELLIDRDLALTIEPSHDAAKIAAAAKATLAASAALEASLAGTAKSKLGEAKSKLEATVAKLDAELYQAKGDASAIVATEVDAAVQAYLDAGVKARDLAAAADAAVTATVKLGGSAESGIEAKAGELRARALEKAIAAENAAGAAAMSLEDALVVKAEATLGAAKAKLEADLGKAESVLAIAEAYASFFAEAHAAANVAALVAVGASQAQADAALAIAADVLAAK